jgi:dihydrofolate reductase
MDNQRNKVIVVAFTTVDGTVEDPDGTWASPSGGWGARVGPETFAGDRFGLAPLLASGAMLYGRRTWEAFAQRWPYREGDFATVMNRSRKVVASTSLRSVEAWSGSILLDGDLVEAVERLRADGPVAVVGSTSIVHQLAAADLVDEYRLRVLPVAAGGGERLFADVADLRLAESGVEDSTVVLRYDVVHRADGLRSPAATSVATGAAR